MSELLKLTGNTMRLTDVERIARATSTQVELSADARQVASNTPREAFTALAVNMSNVGRTGATTVDIVIERYSTRDVHMHDLVRSRSAH